MKDGTSSSLNCVEGSSDLRAAAVRNRDLEINPMTVKLEGYLDNLKIYLYTVNEAASLRHSKHRT